MRRMKQAIALLASFLFAVVVLTGCSQSGTSSSSRDEADLEALYVKQNEFLTCTGHKTYIPAFEPNQNYVFERLFYYCWKTGSTLSFEDVQAYLASEYEEDGSVRIYNNGNWPDIEAYVDWGWAHKDEFVRFHDIALDKKSFWSFSYPELRIEYRNLSIHNLNEVLLTIQDESYEPNFIFE